jgi:carboxyl-terminal processing protease
MKRFERIIWMATVFILITVVFLFFICKKDAFANNKNIFNKLERVKNIVDTYYVDEDKLNDEKLVDGAVAGLLKSIGDPYTEYLPKEYFEELKTTSEGVYGGVGMIISEKDGKIVVISPMEDYPAYKKGIKVGDFLLSVDGKSLKDMSVSKTAELLRGKPGTMVKVEVQRKDLIFEVELKRELIDLPTVKYAIINNKYGYLRITQFAGTTAKHVREALEDFKKKKTKGIVIDLRLNGGGLLGEVIDICDYFMDSGVIVSTIGRYKKEKAEAKPDDTIIDKSIPMVVLIDNGSASASEIFAGAMKDTKRGILIGEKSYGKGSVQSFYQLSEKDGFKLTIAKYYTPSGVCIDGTGIQPDIEIKEPELNDEEKLAVKKIYDDKVIDELLKTNTNPNKEQLDKDVESLLSKGYKLPKRYLKKMIKNAIISDDKQIYDLEFDLQLQKAIEMFDKNEIIYKNDKFIIDKK